MGKLLINVKFFMGWIHLVQKRHDWRRAVEKQSCNFLLYTYISFWMRALFQAVGYLLGCVHPSCFLNFLTINTQKIQLRYSMLYIPTTKTLLKTTYMIRPDFR